MQGLQVSHSLLPYLASELLIYSCVPGARELLPSIVFSKVAFQRFVRISQGKPSIESHAPF